MASIEMGRRHSLDLPAARRKVEDLARDLESKIGLAWRWEGEDRVRFDVPKGPAKGVRGTLSVTAMDVRIEIDLPLLVKPMKGVIASRVQEKLDAFDA